MLSKRSPAPLPSIPLASTSALVHLAQQLGLENVLALLVLLRRLVRLVVLPADRVAAAAADYVAHHVPARRHIALGRVTRVDVDHRVEQVRLAMLAPEVLRLLTHYRR